MARTRSRIVKKDEQTGQVTAAALPLYPKSPVADSYTRNIADYLINQGDGMDAVAWNYFRTIPELHYVVTLMGNALSQVRLYIGETDASDASNPKPVGPRHPARDLMRDFAGGEQGQAELMNRLAVQLTVVGDSILVGPMVPGSPLPYPYDSWNVYSTGEVSSRNGKIFLKGPNFRDESIPLGGQALRIWRKSPQDWWKADSPVKASLSVLRELELLNSHVQATSLSRLKTAGVFVVPEEFTLPGAEVEVEGMDVDPFTAMFTEVMELAIKNPGSAAALVPIMLRGPAEFIQAIKLIDFSTEFDSMITELRNNSIRRLALGLDAPPEVLLGSAESSSWSMWQISEAQLRLHIRPLAYLIADSLTEGWLRPALESLPLPEQTRESIPRIGIYPDFSHLNIRPDVGQDAAALYDALEIGGDTYRHILGLGEADKPTPEEIEYHVYLNTLTTNPAMAAWAIEGLKTHFNVPFIDPEGAQAVGGAGDSEADMRKANAEADKAEAEAKAVGTAPAPTQPGTAPQQPGQRSVKKQTALPKAPPADGDGNSNTSGPS